MPSALLENISIILIGTLQSGNIGSAARAMKTMGVGDLRLVTPKCVVDRQARMMATHAGDILDRAAPFGSLRDAVADLSYVFGTTARDRHWRSVISPRALAEKAVELAAGNRVGIVFGREDSGLSNEELELCDAVMTIPTAQEASSLNLSHAVMVVCYELFSRFTAGYHSKTVLKRARHNSVEALYDHMQNTLLEIGYLNPQNPDIVMGYFKRIISRAGLSEKEVRTMRGIFRQLRWYLLSNRRTSGRDASEEQSS